MKTRLIEQQAVDFDGDLLSLVQDVANDKEADEKKYRRDREGYTKVDEWWVIADAGFDLDLNQREQIDRAIQLAAKKESTFSSITLPSSIGSFYISAILPSVSTSLTI